MRKKYEDIFPAILGLLCLLAVEVINAANVLAQDWKGDFQTISNILLLIIGAYVFLPAMVRKKTTEGNSRVLYFNNFLIVVSAYVLNIDVFENKIYQYSDFLTGWHVTWLLWSVILICLFSGIGKYGYELSRRAFQYLIDRIGDFSGWTEVAVRNSHKGVLFSVAAGVIFWLGLLVTGYTRGGISIEELSRWSLLFWCVWLIICILIAFFSKFMLKIGQSIEELNAAKILKYFMVSVVVFVVVFVSMQLFPSLFQTLGTILSYLLLVFLFIGTVFYLGKQMLPQLKVVCWNDVCVVIGVILFVTFILFPMLGSLTQGGEEVLASDQTDTLTKFISLFTAGLELVKVLL